MNQKLGITMVFIAAMAWSTAGLFTRVVSTDIPTTLFWRSLIGGLCVLLIYVFREDKIDIKKCFSFSRGEFVIGALSTLGMVCFISSFFYTTIANVSFIYGTMPLVTFILAMIFLGVKVDLLSLVSCVMCAIGVMIIMWGVQEFNDIFGIMLAFGMTFFMASLTIAAKYFPEADTTKSTYLSGFLGALITMPFSSFGDTLLIDYAWLAMYGIANLGLGFGVYLFGVQRTTAVTAALVGLMEIPIAPIWAWLLFDEEAGYKTVIGGVVILSATVMYLTMRKTENPAPSKTPSTQEER
ncbi:DMT family transporter [Candidatus Spongiihabitans sp.]|uniref:DMT family transporter n=1 Tax=Candidatus Spongiihabitans sp. TaxID=3101308 RepID=UPI003C6EA976